MKRLAILTALILAGTLSPSAYAQVDEANGNTSGGAAVQAQDGAAQKQGISPALYPATGRAAGNPSILWAALREPTPSSSASLLSQTSPTSSTSADDKWEIINAPYLWLGSLDGESGVGRAGTTSVDVNAGSILKKLQFGFMGRLEVRKGRWGGIFEAAYLELGDSISTATGPITGVERVTDAEFEQTMLEAFLSYRVLRSEKTSVDLFGGARYWDVDIDLEVRGPVITESLSRGERWADPIVGVRVIHSLSDKWFLPVRGDIGGFGRVGATSAFTWNAQGGVGYQISKKVAIVVQYKALGVDFDNGKSGTTDFFAFDAITHGPLVGFVFLF